MVLASPGPLRTPPPLSRGLGWRIYGSVEDTKLSTNKQHSLSLPPPRRPVSVRFVWPHDCNDKEDAEHLSKHQDNNFLSMTHATRAT
jgi:hypothetical protein